jgi:transposase InsO family protein
MGDRLFDPEAQARILRNKNVLRVSETSITYCAPFKIQALRAYLVEGKPPQLIFQGAGFDLDLIGRDTAQRCLRRWRAVYTQRGEEGLWSDQRGRHAAGRSAERELTVEEQLRRAQARVRYLEKENELLKKLDAIERSVVDRPAEKYALIHDLVTAAGKEFTVNYLCEVADVSRSGYYRWVNCADSRLQREKVDYEQHLLIRDIFLSKHRKAGWRVIRMDLERQSIIMNPKKIRRLMKKYELITQVRRANPYKHMAKASQEHRTAPNVLERRFDQGTPYQAFGTDITYLYDGHGQRSYLSILRDIASGEIVAHLVSASLGMDLSLAVIAQATTKLRGKQLSGTLIHSDQGFHYTHPAYIKYLADRGIVQSMSRKGNCLDNAPVESFFGHLKDEIDLTSCDSLDQVRAVVDEYIYHYNHHRYQWNRKKMAPVEYRNHLLAG